MTSEERIKTGWTTRNHASGYIPDEVKLLLDEHAAEQREACACKCKAVRGRQYDSAYQEDVEEACLNAVEKSDGC